MKKGLEPWVREHRTSLPSQGRSLVSRIWPCVAHSCWILSRGTKRPGNVLKNVKKGDSASTDCNTRGQGNQRLKGLLPQQ
ncbi:Inhibin Beta A Chain [Manis pentadactyla]|nr:Inhibin Beta A Chain [Manis pentadactyla]